VDREADVGDREAEAEPRGHHEGVCVAAATAGVGGSRGVDCEAREGGDRGWPVVVSNPDSPQAMAFRQVAEEIARQVSIEAMKPELVVLGKGQ